MRAVFLDRDGVLNAAIVKDGKPFPPPTVDDLVILDEAGEGCKLLRDAGFKLVCVTNQPDIARGSTSAEAVAAINDRVRDELVLDQLRICPHDDTDDCACRKPKPGMLVDAAAELGIELSLSYMVGDRWRDVDAGVAAGCKTVFVDRGYDEPKPASADFTTRSTFDACLWIASQTKTIVGANS